MLTRAEIEGFLRILLKRYHAQFALLFGSYARGNADEHSDLDVVVYGGKDFKATDIFAFAEELREMSGKDADVFEIRELNQGTPFYEQVMREGIRIA